MRSRANPREGDAYSITIGIAGNRVGNDQRRSQKLKLTAEKPPWG